jgi:hypothetical protein
LANRPAALLLDTIVADGGPGNVGAPGPNEYSPSHLVREETVQASRRLLVAAATAAWAACVTPQRLAPAARDLKVVEEARPGCAYLGLAVGASHPSSVGTTAFFGDAVTEDARNRAINAAADMGATHVVLGDPRREEGTTYFAARAYRCEEGPSPPPAALQPPATPPAEPATEPAAPSGCGKDTDCKGDRVCEAGKCVDPRPAPTSTPR